MTDRKPSWRELNAYADGELAASETAAVARAVAEDPALADQVATLARLKATIHEQARAPQPEELTWVSRNTPRTSDASGRLGRRTWTAIGAVAAGLAALLIVGTLLLPIGPETGQPSWREFALRLHETWAESAAEQASEPTADTLLASLSQLGQAAQVPDLSGARLTVGYLRPIASPYGHGLQVGYRGTRGCRVSLIILPAAAGLAEEPVPLGTGGSQAYAWRVGGLGYALLASGMDPGHYAVVLETVHQASRTLAPVGPETRTALTRSRARSRPCAT